MKKYISIAACVVLAIDTLGIVFAAELKTNTVHPAPISSPLSGAPTPKNFHMPPEALQRELHELERAQHLLEMSSQNDRSGHESAAARHINAAVNELKFEVRKNAKEKTKGEPTKAAGAAAPVARR